MEGHEGIESTIFRVVKGTVDLYNPKHLLYQLNHGGFKIIN
jgi:hypothetical protein